MRCILAVILMGAGLFAARGFLDVTLPQSDKESALRIIAIAIAPCAIYGICSASGELSGTAMGVGISLVVYSLLFMALMQLDTKDTVICVMLTWTMVAIANYIAFRVAGAAAGSSI